MAGKPNTAWLETMTERYGSREALTEHMQSIGSRGGKNGTTGGFASNIVCSCNLIDEEHFKRNCSGKKGGRVSRRRDNYAKNITV